MFSKIDGKEHVLFVFDKKRAKEHVGYEKEYVGRVRSNHQELPDE
jgi:hypothetical protein